jgi:hypothetical protein
MVLSYPFLVCTPVEGFSVREKLYSELVAYRL